MYPLKKGKFAQQAHVGIPAGTFEEEHGRKGFYGKSAHLYHAHPPTGWIRFEGKLRPHLFDLNKLAPSDCHDPQGMPVAFLGNDDIRLYVSRRSQPMPFYYRNADGDELIFVHRGKGVIETDFGPLQFEPGDYLVLPRAVTYRLLPETTDNFFLIIQSKTEFDQPDKGLIGHHALYDPGVITTPEPAPHLDDNNEWEVRIKVDDEISKVIYPFNPIDVVGWKGDLTVWKINMRDIRPIMSHRAHLPPSAAHHVSDRGRGGLQFPAASAGTGRRSSARSVLPPQHRLRRVHFLSRRRFLQQRQRQAGIRHAPSARHPSRPASQGSRESRQENPDRRVCGDARRAQSHPRAAGGRAGGMERVLG